MTQEIDRAQYATGHEVADDKAGSLDLTGSPLSRTMQGIGEHIMGSPRLVEVQAGVFSTCQEPIDTLAGRLVRARDTGVPLVEVTMFPKEGRYEALRQLFGTSGLVHSILRSDGVEQPDHFNGKVIRAEVVALPTFGNGDIAPDGSEVTVSLASNSYYGYDNGEVPGNSGSYRYEHDLGYGLVPADRLGIHAALDRIVEDFKVASMRDGAIEGTVVAEDTVRAELNPGH